MRGVSARQELTGEWFKRGAGGAGAYRGLTNELTRAAFGLDVEGLRGYKNLRNTGANLRDHMNDLELALTTLAETLAVTLHRARGSQGVAQLEADVHDAGEIVARTRAEIESRGGKPVLTPGNYRAWWQKHANGDRAVA